MSAYDRCRIEVFDGVYPPNTPIFIGPFDMDGFGDVAVGATFIGGNGDQDGRCSRARLEICGYVRDNSPALSPVRPMAVVEVPINPHEEVYTNLKVNPVPDCIGIVLDTPDYDECYIYSPYDHCVVYLDLQPLRDDVDYPERYQDDGY